MRSLLRLLIVCALLSALSYAQSPNATVTGRVTDPINAVIADAQVEIINLYTNIHYTGQTNREGSFVIPSLPPGPYRIEVKKSGFKTVVREDVVLRVEDVVALNFTLPVGSVSESVTVTGGAPLVNTESAAVSTVVDRQFAENLPMNGRSFQSLIQLAPGAVTAKAGEGSNGQLSVNGQRSTSNNFIVDGVSANVGVNPSNYLGQEASGSLPSFSAIGSTQNLLSVDALQEFRINTASYAPEFGRFPGAQVSLVTRSGTNQFHGTLFDYLRNDALDANDWFANDLGLPRSPERQNDFGGVLGGPIIKDKTFFFFSYEGLRLLVPTVAHVIVPSLSARQNAPAGVQPYLNAFPAPNGADHGNGTADFNSSLPNNSDLDSYAIRIDQNVNSKLSLFGRYSYSPSEADSHSPFETPSVTSKEVLTTKSLTAGSTWTISPNLVDETRFNYSHNEVNIRDVLGTFGGAAVPPDSILFPAPYTSASSSYLFQIFGGQLMQWFQGKIADNTQRQINVVDNLSWQHGGHLLKFGVDYRRLSPHFGPELYNAEPAFLGTNNVLAQSLFFLQVRTSRGGTALFNNLGAFAQDTWRTTPRLTLTYGLRWDLDLPPRTTDGPPLVAINSIENVDQIRPLPLGAPLWRTTYGNFAPRFGAAYQLRQQPGWTSVLRGGFGLFYDLASTEAGSALLDFAFPFGASARTNGGPNPSNLPFPLTPADATPPQLTNTPPVPLNSVTSFDPHLQLPYTLDWNVALEQQLGRNQTLSATYVGSVGQRLLQREFLGDDPNNPFFSQSWFLRNAASSTYNALQLQYLHRLASGLQVNGSYTLSHSIDTGSSAALQDTSSSFSFGLYSNRGSSDFDVRHSFKMGLTYEAPSPSGVLLHAIFGGWAADNIVQVRTATPFDVMVVSEAAELATSGAAVRPDIVPGVPPWLYGSQYPGGKALNANAFAQPASDPAGFVISQGNLPRNFFRGFGAAQWDFSLRRQLTLKENVKLQFRAEFFNVLNHPNFGDPNHSFASAASGFADPSFGLSTSSLAQSLGGLNSLYQFGGPRSIQLALKLLF